MGRPSFKPTEEQRKLVFTLASIGTPQTRISEVVGCSLPTLEKHFREELDNAVDRANAAVVQSLWNKAVYGEGRDGAAAAMFWCKTRMGWKETQKVDVEGGLTVRVEYVDDPEAAAVGS